MIKLTKDKFLTADGRHQFILFEKQVIETGKKKGELLDTNKKFYPKIEQVLQRVFNELLWDELSKEDHQSIQILEHIVEDAAKKILLIGKALTKDPGLLKTLKDKEVFDLDEIPTLIDPPKKEKPKKIKKIKKSKKVKKSKKIKKIKKVKK